MILNDEHILNSATESNRSSNFILPAYSFSLALPMTVALLYPWPFLSHLTPKIHQLNLNTFLQCRDKEYFFFFLKKFLWIFNSDPFAMDWAKSKIFHCQKSNKTSFFRIKCYFYFSPLKSNSFFFLLLIYKLTLDNSSILLLINLFEFENAPNKLSIPVSYL